MDDPLADLHREVSELKRKLTNMFRAGKVTEIDHARGLVKFKDGEFESGWLPWAEQAGGDSGSGDSTVYGTKTRSMPVIGQQVAGFHPNGQPDQGWVMPAGYQQAVPITSAPAPNGEHVVKRGEVTHTRTGKSDKVQVGDATVELVNGKTTVTQGGVKVVLVGGKVHLGDEGGPAVVTTAGPSSIVFAKV